MSGGALSLVALVSAGCTPAWSVTAPPGTTVIDFEDYPVVCLASQRILPPTDCYRPRGVSIEGGTIVDFSRDRTPPVRVGGAKAIESCTVQTSLRCTGRISMTFTMPVIRVAMRVGHSTDLLVERTGSCPGPEIDYGGIVLAAFAGSSQVEQDSVRASARCQAIPAFLGPLRKPGLDGRLEVASPTGNITRVEVGWDSPNLSAPIIVDDLEFQPAAADLTITPSVLDLGEVSVSDTTARAETLVSNDGNIAVAIAAVEINGTNPEDFTLSGDCVGRTLPPGSSCRVVVTFAAGSEGQRTATLTVVTATGSSRAAALTGTGVGGPTPLRLPLAAGLAVLALIALLFIFGLILIARRLAKGRRAKDGVIQQAPARVWVQPGPVAETIRMKGPEIAVGVVLDPTTSTVTWSARRTR